MSDFTVINEFENEFYKVSKSDILKAEQRMNIRIPNELRQLYLEVGYGFIKGESPNAINRILDPETLADFRLREDIFESDPDLDEIYDDENKLVFFEVNEGVYLSLDLILDNNPVFYFHIQIADSLEDFINRFLKNNEYYIDLMGD